MNRTVTCANLHQNAAGRSDDLAYWLRQPVQARLAAVEVLRQDYIRTLPDAEQRLQKSLPSYSTQTGLNTYEAFL